MTQGSDRNVQSHSNSIPAPDSPPYLALEPLWAMSTPEGSRGQASWDSSSMRLARPGHPMIDQFQTPTRSGNITQVLTPPDSGLRFARSDRTALLFAQARWNQGSVPSNWNATALGAHMPLHTHGTIGDRRLPSVPESENTTLQSQNLIPHATPSVYSGPYHQPTGPNNEQSFNVADHHPTYSIENDRNTTSVYFQPMSNLLATGLQYIPEPSGRTRDAMGQTIITPGRPTTPAGARPRPGSYHNALFTDVDRIAAGFSPRYRGDVLLRSNQSEDIPEDQNCSLFLVNLPAAVTTRELLAAVHALGPTGRVYATHINAPEPARGHAGCAAKLVFFRRDVAHAFYARCAALAAAGGGGGGARGSADGSHSGPGLLVAGQMARVMWNRIRTSERALPSGADASRVLLIAGPPAVVNERALTAFFRARLEFQVDSVLTHVAGRSDDDDDEGEEGEEGVHEGGASAAVVEYRFGSFRCQAQAARLALLREAPQVDCFFGSDPLEPCAWKPFEYCNFGNGIDK